ncbi:MULTISPECIES: UDP-glucose dehydrogenase family protein [Bacillus cereus group]|uniref:UDP-glucose 6-dehydrogenase n=1 Tax=Bacillus cereus TaxID=1396 RepID=A0A9W7UWA4_BACCE|nr:MULTISPECIES: UDP-glucose/GDP-mannose dehydrogenase family protein [Bacillus cereus group]KAB2393461.1 UDP-glucose/GDP-mannose dehydrogenase family protein [Bacillus cereus]KAB2407408.1 UDP-glucose/GDP-mannose dehydrogenase family protein [Bacillus cereus]KAB2428593.1 UDP-glucose/GDP-mannose dehydrogenase family protein [Bacillus cereus]MEB9909337.1 UDP-glucose/GDP-mannose dehydrogenase family protein [Bacillus anthracis]MEC1954520.1 UDP-glucose/GDP-mannose dehydrogenase family protein [Bac
MDICIIGSGYVGITSAAVLADLGHDVICVDKDQEKIHSLQKGECPIYEPDLKELIQKNRNRLQFSCDIDNAIRQSPVIFIAVGTPSTSSGKTDLKYIYSVIDLLVPSITSYKTIIMKSTVPPGTNQLLYETLIKRGVSSALFNIVSNPEFLREGSAVHDMLIPDRTIIGIQKGDTTSLKIMQDIYKGISAPFLCTGLNEAEMIKYTSNVFLATKISFINEISRICDAYNIDIVEVAKGIGYDFRINPHFLQAGMGYGGSCFPKDLHSLIYTANDRHVAVPILQAVQFINSTQIDLYVEKIKKAVKEPSSKKITVLGIAFKPNTDDIRSSLALLLLEKLIPHGYDLHAYDPKAFLPSHLKRQVTQHDNLESSITNSDCIIIATEWDEFKTLNWKQVKQVMKGCTIVDGRNCIAKDEIEKYGLQYIGVGRS